MTTDDQDPAFRIDMRGGGPAAGYMTAPGPDFAGTKRDATHLDATPFIALANPLSQQTTMMAHSPLPSGNTLSAPSLNPTASAPSSTLLYTTPLPAVSPPLYGAAQHHNPACPPDLHSMQPPRPVHAGPASGPSTLYGTTPVPPMHISLPEHRPPPLSMPMPVTPMYDESGNYLYHPQSTSGQISPYQPSPLSADPASASSGPMADYFPPYHASQATPIQPVHNYLPTPVYQNAGLPLISPPIPHGAQPKSGPSRHNNTKTGRQQFSACGACRHRRVKCDLREKQEKLQKDNSSSEQAKAEAKKRGRRAICTNCEERGIACIDEYAPLKAAKQLRRGKRISEIEVIYGKPATEVAAMGTDLEPPLEEPIPELSREFFESAFFRRFQVQRPILDPQNFLHRYLSAKVPTAAAMGPEGAVLCHVLYAWALSYGVDHRGELDVPEGGGAPLGVLSVASPGPNEMRREADRQNRFEQMRAVVEVALREIDEIGIMRKPTWDGVRVLLLILPLTEGIATSVERLAMYEAALNQVYALCSFGGLGYDGRPSGTSSVNGGQDKVGITNVQLVRVRIYWYAFVHEGITTGLKGGRLHLDEEDLETMQDSIHNRAIVVSSTTAFHATIKFATAPIHLALACRMVNRALTGPSARRKQQVNAGLVKDTWEALERSWEEFEALKNEPLSEHIYKTSEDVVRFADGWKIFLFEAQSVIRRVLNERLELAVQRLAGLQITDGASPAEDAEVVKLRHLADIAKSKCEVKTKQILAMVRRHVGSRFFEWDASLVRDGTFYAAKLLPSLGMSEEDMGFCLQALNELRWAHAKAFERSTELRKVWTETRHGTPCSIPSIDLPGPTDGAAMPSQGLPTLQMTSLHLQPIDPNDSFPGSAMSGDSNPASAMSRSASPIYPTGEMVSPSTEYPAGYGMAPVHSYGAQPYTPYHSQTPGQSHSLGHTPVEYTHVTPMHQASALPTPLYPTTALPHVNMDHDGTGSPHAAYPGTYMVPPDQQYQQHPQMVQHHPPHQRHHLQQPSPPHQMYVAHPSHAPPTQPRFVPQQVPTGYTQSHMLQPPQTQPMPSHMQTQQHPPPPQGYASDGYMYADTSAPPRLRQFDNGYYPQ